MIIVSNSGPIIGLAKIKQLVLLRQLAETVLVPPQVEKEVLAKSGPDAATIEEALADFIKAQAPVAVEDRIADVVRSLDEGEREAILLAHGIPSALLLLDDRAGRSVAKKMNLRVTGLPGLLLLAKQRGLVPEVVPLIEEIRSNGYWLSDSVVGSVRRLANE